MADDKLQDYLNKGMYGVTETNPDERRVFLGSLRERAYLMMTKEALLSGDYMAALRTEIAQHPGNQLLLNGSISIASLKPYIQLANQENIPFTIVNQLSNQSCALVYTAKTAVNEEVIDVTVKYPCHQKNLEQEPQKKSFFSRIFH